MWRLVSAAKRERNAFSSSFRSLRQQNGLLSSCLSSSSIGPVGACTARALSNVATSGGSSPDVAVQLDYYMSLQFAGVAYAFVNDVYRTRGISSLHFLPTCPVGHELFRVRSFQDANPSTLATLGTVEQNVFTPTLYDDPTLNVTAVAGMFRRSPLCVASLGELREGDVIGAHEDTVELLRRILPGQRVVASPRGTKNTDLLDGMYDGIQAYTTTEVPALRRLMESKGIDPDRLHFQVLEDIVDPNTSSCTPQLGYSQMIFAASEALGESHPDRREAVRAFLEGTFEGWDMAIRDPDSAIRAVKEARRMLRLDDEDNDHWHDSSGFEREMLELTTDHVKETFVGDRLGVISADRWGRATEWLLHDKNGAEPSFGLDKTGLWQPPPNLLHGNEIGRELLHDAKVSALKFERTHGRKPSLAVIAVGELERYEHSERRLQLYSNPSNSWFTKSDVGKANGFDVMEVNLDEKSATADKLLSEVYKLRDQVDGIQLMWPLPSLIDASKVYKAIPLEKDVDGIHYASWGSKYCPVTPAGAMELMRAHNVEVKGRHVLVVGRSPIVGAPMAHMMREAGAMVTVAHSDISQEMLEGMVGQADVLVTCAGSPGAIQASWLKEGCNVINVGTTFCEESDTLLSDIEGDVSIRAGRYSPVPGGVGPLSIPVLFGNVARAAWDQVDAESSTWVKRPAALGKSFHFDSYTKALQFAQKVDEMSTIMDHHANMKIVHKCVNGVDLEMEFFSFEANELTQKDRDAAWAVDLIHGGNPIRMNDYSYDLKQESIALFPAEPRGSSRLVWVDSGGCVSYFNHFGDSIASLLEGCHVVFNNSRVLNARLSVNLGDGDPVELMLLDLGNIDPSLPCSDHAIQAMIRSQSVSKGDVYVEPVSGAKVEVVDFKGIWEEEKDSGGNGSDCVIRIYSQYDIGSFLSANGSVPIPPYLHREAVGSDKERYNNVYAKDGGSVAAPTAGLHFTDGVLTQIGESNASSLTLHVGAGTFMPVLSNDARDHSMHAEHFYINVGELRSIARALEERKPLAVVGTTSTRTLESLYWLGVKRLRGLPDSDHVKRLELGQFEWIPLSVADPSITPVAAINAIIDGLPDHEVISGKTSLMITPNSYRFKVVDHLVTNFHSPDSTLMLLVSAFLGKQSNITKIYQDAQARGYRFLSYGDVCLFSRPGRQ